MNKIFPFIILSILVILSIFLPFYYLFLPLIILFILALYNKYLYLFFILWALITFFISKEYIFVILIVILYIILKLFLNTLNNEYNHLQGEVDKARTNLLKEKNKLTNLNIDFEKKIDDYKYLLNAYFRFLKASSTGQILKQLLNTFGHILKNTGYIIEKKEKSWELIENIGEKVDINLFNFDSNIFRHVILFKEPLIIENIDKDLRFNTVCGIENIKSTIIFPIIVNYHLKYIIKWDFSKEKIFDYRLIKLLQTLVLIASNVININFYSEELTKLGTIDRLTQLYDKKELDKKLEYILKNERHFPFSILMIDIDNFKKVNEIGGEKLGDFLLKELGKLFKQNLRIYDIPFRIGGEEFLILLPDTNKDDALSVGERLRETVENYIFKHENNKIKITITVGIAYLSNEIYTKKKLLTAAKKALAEGKKRGKNICVLYQKKE